MSAGEAKSIDIFSGVYQIINRNIGLKDKKLILLLDEPDKGMHPELTRKFISILNDFSEEIGNKYRCKFQYIISTHSPFLILDVPETNVYRMDIKNEKIVLKRGNKGIMSNVVDLIKDDFFLESVFGELSEKYFKEVDIPNGVTLKKAKIHESLIEADAWINVPILKNHGGAKLSCAMKNMMGIVWDRRFFHQNDLQQCIADICTWKKKPVLNIVDAYRMMHQNGPQGKSAADVATLKSMIVSPNIVAVDTAALALFNQVKKLDMAAVGHLSKGEALKLGSTDLKKINIKRIKI